MKKQYLVKGMEKFVVVDKDGYRSVAFVVPTNKYLFDIPVCNWFYYLIAPNGDILYKLKDIDITERLAYYKSANMISDSSKWYN